MQRIAVIGDIHADLEALELVLAAAEQANADEIWCLGDAIGRGREHVECLELVLARCSRVLLGNHEAYQLDPEAHDPTLTDHGRAELLPTRAQLGADPRWPALAERIRTLTSWERQGRLLLIHASPADALWHALTNLGDVFLIGRELPPGTVVVHGHTHIPACGTFSISGKVRLALGQEELGYLLAGADTLELDQESVYFLSPGSVGPSRDGGRAVAWGLLTLSDEGEPSSFQWRSEPRE